MVNENNVHVIDDYLFTKCFVTVKVYERFLEQNDYNLCDMIQDYNINMYICA